MSVVKSGGRLLAGLLIAAILGGILASVADMVAMEYIAGTPLGPMSEASPVLWTGIGGLVLLGFNEVYG